VLLGWPTTRHARRSETPPELLSQCHHGPVSVSHDLLQPLILHLQLVQALGVVGLHAVAAWPYGPIPPASDPIPPTPGPIPPTPGPIPPTPPPNLPVGGSGAVGRQERQGGKWLGTELNILRWLGRGTCFPHATSRNSRFSRLLPIG
jgi:hypothetical protein